jgi:hypothetical protein
MTLTGEVGSTRTETSVPFRPPQIPHHLKRKNNHFNINATFLINLRQQEILQVQKIE